MPVFDFRITSKRRNRKIKQRPKVEPISVRAANEKDARLELLRLYIENQRRVIRIEKSCPSEYQ